MMNRLQMKISIVELEQKSCSRKTIEFAFFPIFMVVTRPLLSGQKLIHAFRFINQQNDCQNFDTISSH